MLITVRLWYIDDGDDGVFMTVIKIMVVEVIDGDGNENNMVNIPF